MEISRELSMNCGKSVSRSFEFCAVVLNFDFLLLTGVYPSLRGEF